MQCNKAIHFESLYCFDYKAIVMRFSLLLFLFCFLSCNGVAEKKTKETNYFEGYAEAIDKEVYLDSIATLIIKRPNDSLTREALLRLANRYEWIKRDKKVKKNLEKLYSYSKQQGDTAHIAKTYWYLGDYYDRRQILDSAYFYYLKAEKLYALQKDSINWAKMLSYKAGVLHDTGVYTESETTIAQVLQVLSKQKNTRLIYEANFQMASVLKELKEYRGALEYYVKIPELLNRLEEEGYDKYNLQRSWLSYYNNIGGYYQEVGNLEEAKNYFQTALRNQYVDSFPRLKAMVLNNYGYNQMLLCDDPQVIQSTLESALDIRTRINHKQGIVASKIRIAELNFLKKDTLTALVLMKEAYAMAAEDKNLYELIESLKFLSEYDVNDKEFYTTIYLRTQDSIRTLERLTRNKFARIEYETGEIEKRNDLLKQRNAYLGGVILLVVLLSIVFFIVLSLRMKNKKLLYQQKDQQAIHQIQALLLQQQSITYKAKNKQRKQIAKDLHDSIINRVFTVRINLGQLSTDQTQEKEKLIDQLTQIEAQTRALSHNMHKTLFNQEQDFSLVLENLILSQKNQFETVFECSIDRLINWDVYTLYQKAQLYLIVQVLLQNVNKHAQATKCLVIILLSEHHIIVKIHDNGIGIDTKKIDKGLGFKNIKHRLEALQGKMTISTISQMTTISLEIPYFQKNI